MLLLAWASSPTMVGIYAWGTLIYTFIVALSDSPMRHIALRAAGSSNGDRFIRRYQYITVAGGPSTFTALVLLVALFSPDSSSSEYWNLAPLGLATVFLALNIRNVGLLQANGRWRNLAHAQLIGAAGLLTVGLPITFLWNTALGPAVGVATAELIVFLKCRNLASTAKGSSSLPTKAPRMPAGHRAYGRDFKDVSFYTTLTWTQGQFDRILIGFIGGAATLGLISFASAISRALGDAVAASNANVIRSEIIHSSGKDAAVSTAEPLLLRGIWMATATAILVAVPGRYILDLILGPEWEPTLDIIPILSLISIPSILSWSFPVLNIAVTLGRRALVGPSVAILLGPAVAALAVADLRLFAVGVLVREFIMILINYVFMGHLAPWRVFVRAIMHSLALTLLFLLIYPQLLPIF